MLRDPPHYLKPLRTTTTPKRLLFLSCRGYVSRKRSHYEHRFQAAALGQTHWTARSNKRVDRLDTFDSPDALWDDVQTRLPKGKRVVMFTYDLAEQMRLSQMLTHLPQAGYRLDKIVLERTASWCLFRNDKRSLMCCDLRSWMPVGFEKIVGSLPNIPDGWNKVRAGSMLATTTAQMRAIVIREAVLQIINWIEGENLGQFRPTGSGQSFTAYRRRFLSSRLLVHDDVTRLSAERTAMHTGRAEAWRHGRLGAGPYVEYDLHAAYATIGRDCSVPTVSRGERQRPKLEWLLRAMGRYATLAHVTVTTEVECVPYQVNGRTMWPVGTFSTWLWDPELQLAFDYADNVTVNHVYLYNREPALRDFCTYVLDNMENQTQVYGLIPQRVLKHWSRCLVGRFGLRYRAWHRFGPHSPPDVRLCDYVDLIDGTKTEMLLAGDQRLLLGDLTESRESMPQIPGWVMSECRRRLWEMMTKYAQSDLVYCDTDSVIMRMDPILKLKASFIDPYGTTWIRKGTYRNLTIYGPRNIEVGHSRRVSGLPLSATQRAPLHFEGEVMRGVKRSLRNGDIDHVVSLPRTFHLEATDFRRQHNPDGSTSPYRIEETCQ
jgi:hypothetical protein